MLEELRIIGFKCFDTVEISLRKMNLFVGTNSSGKSSAIQAFLLLSNNSGKNSSSPLNGMWLRMGTFDECRNHRINARKFTVGLVREHETFQAEFCSADDDDREATVSFSHESNSIQDLLSFEKRQVYYLPANRIRPEDSYPKNFDRVNFLGNKAEFIIDFLYKNRKREVAPTLIADSASVTLEYQVNYWLGRLFGIQNTIRDLGLSNSLSVEFALRNGKPARPYHLVPVSVLP